MVFAQDDNLTVARSLSAPRNTYGLRHDFVDFCWLCSPRLTFQAMVGPLCFGGGVDAGAVLLKGEGAQYTEYLVNIYEMNIIDGSPALCDLPCYIIGRYYKVFGASRHRPIRAIPRQR